MIFCAGCDFRCPFCSNSSLIPTNSGREVELKDIKKRILGNRSLLDAVGLTGGEPSLQPEPITELFGWVKDIGLKTFLNTNGSNPQFVKGLAEGGLLDHVAIDVKAPLKPEAYGPVIGLQKNVEEVVEGVEETIRICKGAKIPIEVRTTIVPTLIDDENSVREIAQSIKDDCDIYVIQQFYPFDEVLDPGLRRLKPPKRGFLMKLAKAALKEGVREVYVRTREYGMERVEGV